MKKIINLHFESMHRGPGRVVDNLARGLKSIGYEVHGNDLPRPTILQGSLQLTRMIHALGRDTLMGPNLFVLPGEWGEYCKRFNHYIVPSSWVVDTYRRFDLLDHASIDVWPVGIDTESWKKEKTRQDRVLVYFKNREQSVLDDVVGFLEKSNISFEVIKYGSYNEKDLFNACMRCDSCILISGTESQGVAYMQILSMGIPCYVVNKLKFDYFDIFKENPPDATSVPYFDDSCGIIRDNFNPSDFESFRESVMNFDSRNYIVNNFTLSKCAEDYISIITKYL